MIWFYLDGFCFGFLLLHFLNRLMCSIDDKCVCANRNFYVSEWKNPLRHSMDADHL